MLFYFSVPQYYITFPFPPFRYFMETVCFPRLLSSSSWRETTHRDNKKVFVCAATVTLSVVPSCYVFISKQQSDRIHTRFSAILTMMYLSSCLIYSRRCIVGCQVSRVVVSCHTAFPLLFKSLSIVVCDS